MILPPKTTNLGGEALVDALYDAGEAVLTLFPKALETQLRHLVTAAARLSSGNCEWRLLRPPLA